MQLQAENERLRGELAQLQAENERLRGELAQLQAAAPADSAGARLERMMHEIIRLQREAAASAPQPAGARLERMMHEIIRQQREAFASAPQVACAAQVVARRHAAIFPQLRGSLRGRRVALLGSGPSLRQAPALGACLTGACNHSHLFLKDRAPDYYFAFDFRGNVVREALAALPQSTSIFVGSSISPLCEAPMQAPEQLQDDPRITIYCDFAGVQPRIELESYPVYQCGTVMHDALHIMLYMAPDVIYLLGCDCTPAGYFDERPNPGNSAELLYSWRRGYTLLRSLQATHRPQTRIISVNPIGLRGVFEDVYTTAFLKLSAQPPLQPQLIEAL